MARLARSSPDRIVRNSGQMLEAGIDTFARILRARFIRTGDGTDVILEEYARQHRQQPVLQGELPEWPAG